VKDLSEAHDVEEANVKRLVSEVEYSQHTVLQLVDDGIVVQQHSNHTLMDLAYS
jgi:hypothetical protein